MTQIGFLSLGVFIKLPTLTSDAERNYNELSRKNELIKFIIFYFKKTLILRYYIKETISLLHQASYNFSMF